MNKQEVYRIREFRRDSKRIIYTAIKSFSYFFRIFKSIFTFFNNEVKDNIKGSVGDLFRGDDIFDKGEGSFRSKFNRGMLVEGGGDKEEVLDKEIGFSNDIMDDMESKSGKFLEREERVMRVKRLREIFTEAEEFSDNERVREIGFNRDSDSFFKVVDPEGIKSKEGRVKLIKERRGCERGEDMEIVKRSRFRSDKERGRIRFNKDRGDKRDSLRDASRGIIKRFL